MRRIPSGTMIRRMLVDRGVKRVRNELIKRAYDAPSIDVLAQIREKMVERGEAQRLAPPAPPRVAAAKDKVLTAVLAELTKAAEQGIRCPTNGEIGASVGRAVNSVRLNMAQLVSRGTIEVRQKSFVRAVKIVSTGNTTAGWDTIFDPPVRQHAPRVVVEVQPLSLRVPCPYCGCRLDADPSLCCAPGRAMRRMAA